MVDESWQKNGCCRVIFSAKTCVRLGGSQALLSSLAALLAVVETNNTLVLGLLNRLLGLGQNDFNVARRRTVGVDATVGTVGTTVLLGGLVDLDVLDNKLLGVETLGIGVGLGVLEEVLNELDRLDGPAGLGHTKLLSLASAADRAGVAAERNGTLVLLDVLKVLEGLVKGPATDSGSGLESVLERDTEVRAASSSALGGVSGRSTVSGHC